MTTTEAMKLALEALKELVAQIEGRYFCMKHDHVALQNARFAIARLREALASEAIEQPAQRQARSADTWVNATTWRGLTDEDIDQCLRVSDGSMGRLLSAIEVKLKEKNT